MNTFLNFIRNLNFHVGEGAREKLVPLIFRQGDVHKFERYEHKMSTCF